MLIVLLPCRVLHSFVDNMETISLVRECRELDEWFEMNVVDKLLSSGEVVDIKRLEERG